MSDEFDAYHKWLGIPPEEQPPHHYRLLGLHEFEDDAEVIEAAARRQQAYLNGLKVGPQGKRAQQLLDEVDRARDCLLTPHRKAAYDQRLRSGDGPAPESDAPAAESNPAAAAELGQSTNTALGELFAATGGRKRKARREPHAEATAGTPDAAHDRQGRPSGMRLYLIAAGMGTLGAVAVMVVFFLTSGQSNAPPKNSAPGTKLVFDWSESARGETALKIDGQEVKFPGEGRLEVPCEPGEHVVSAERKRFLPYQETVALKRGEERPVVLRWRNEATLVLIWPQTERSDAQLQLDGQNVTLERLDALAGGQQVQFAVTAGNHELRIRRAGFQDFKRTVVVPAKDSQMLTVVWVPESKTPPVDLLALIDPAKHASAAPWTRDASQAVISPASTIARLTVPCIPPEEYVLTSTIERRSGVEYFSFVLSAQGRQVALILDGWRSTVSGLDTLDSCRLCDHAQAFRGSVAATGRPVEVVIVVRKSGIQAMCDQETVVNWAGDFGTLGLVPELALARRDTLGLASGESSFRISRLLLTPLSGEVQLLEPVPGEPIVKQPGVQSPNALTTFQGHRYELVRDGLPWREAVRECERRGGYLCCVETAAEQEFLVKNVIVGQAAWLGGTDVNSETIWNWINGQPLTYANWMEGAPSNDDDAEHHLEIRSDGTWNDFLGGCRKNFVSEWDQESAPSPAKVPPERSAALDRLRQKPVPGSIQAPLTFSGHAYALVDTPLTWDDAVAACRDLKGYLCCVESEAENRFLQSSFGRYDRIWLGGSDATEEGKWKWANGSPFQYVNWGGSDPNNAFDGSEHSLEMLNPAGQWNDRSGSRRNVFVCEWDTTEPPMLKSVTRPAADRLAAPDNEARDKAVAVLKEKFAQDYRRSDRHASLGLAAHLIRLAEKSKDPAEVSAMLSEARRLALQREDVPLLLAACESLAQRFDVDASRLQAESLGAVAERIESPAEFSMLAETARRVGRETKDLTLLAGLVQTAGTLDKSGRRLKSPLAATAAAGLQQELKLFGRLLQAAQEADATLKDNPQDPSANTRSGIYHAVVDQDWNRALTRLAKGNQEGLATASAGLLKDRSDPLAQLALGDAWWSAAEHVEDQILANAYREAASYWYREFLPRANSEQRVQIRMRLAKLRNPAAVQGTFAMPLHGLAGLAGMVPVKQTGPVAPFRDGFAAFGPKGSLEYGTLPVVYFVHEIELELLQFKGEFYLHYGSDDSNWLVVNGDPAKRQLHCQYWDSGVNGTWGGGTWLPAGSRVTLVIYGSPRGHGLWVNDRPVLGSGSTARDLWLRMSTNDTASVRVYRCVLRPWDEGDASLLRQPLPVSEVAGDVAATALLLRQRERELPTKPDPKMPKEFLVETTGTPMQWIAPGSFRRSYGADKPATQVRISRGFWMGRYEVSQEEWLRIAPANPSRTTGSPFLPVDGASMDAVHQFCLMLTKREELGRRLPPGYFYRLPTEAEWEYACRAGVDGDFSVPTDDFWHFGTAGNHPHEIGRSQPNAWGLYDMHGNVSEWCLDTFRAFPDPAPAQLDDPWERPEPKERMVERGGAWWLDAGGCSSAWRHRHTQLGGAYRGFRIVLAPRLQ